MNRKSVLPMVLALSATVSAVRAAPDYGTAGAFRIANEIRAAGCERRPGVPQPLHRRSELDAAAWSLAQGRPLRDAVARSGYRAVESASVHLAGPFVPRDLASALGTRLCRALTDRDYRDLGLYADGRGVWVLAAREFVPPSPRDTPWMEREVLERVNAARAAGRRCGGERFAPAPPLEPSPELGRVALEHSLDMATHAEFEHVGHDGSTPAVRVRRTGYTARIVGENIAYGSLNAAEAVAGWLDSPGHCANIMDPRFKTTGIAVAADRHGGPALYWTQDFVAR